MSSLYNNLIKYYQLNKKINLLDLNPKQMSDFFVTLGEKKYLANQVMRWIYHYGCADFNQMTNISKRLGEKLKDLAIIKAPEIIEEHQSSDGTIKWLMSIDQKQKIETIYIPEKNRTTLCISTQVGCSLNCNFCYTGKQGFARNLHVSEIIGQIWCANKKLNGELKKHNNTITNVVLMGMGEPLLNLSNVSRSIELMLAQNCLGLSKRHVTISTSGIVPALNQLVNKKIDVVLAISLHAPNDKLRTALMPINKKYNICNILRAARNYINKSYANQGKITIEYVMIHQVNDLVEHAQELAKCLRNTPCKINLIPWNYYPQSYFKQSAYNSIKKFNEILTSYGFFTCVRKTRGNDINAACGQLSGQVFPFRYQKR
ncbi:MAG: 23S rRNA (adenine(2503)-C(2))-methyltransferase RlmN [Candidatus Dasytiphilus stammeri]